MNNQIPKPMTAEEMDAQIEAERRWDRRFGCLCFVAASIIVWAIILFIHESHHHA